MHPRLSIHFVIQSARSRISAEGSCGEGRVSAKGRRRRKVMKVFIVIVEVAVLYVEECVDCVRR